MNDFKPTLKINCDTRNQKCRYPYFYTAAKHTEDWTWIGCMKRLNGKIRVWKSSYSTISSSPSPSLPSQSPSLPPPSPSPPLLHPLFLLRHYLLVSSFKFTTKIMSCVLKSIKLWPPRTEDGTTRMSTIKYKVTFCKIARTYRTMEGGIPPPPSPYYPLPQWWILVEFWQFMMRKLCCRYIRRPYRLKLLLDIRTTCRHCCFFYYVHNYWAVSLYFFKEGGGMFTYCRVL